jgi:hypothetical protein
VRPFRTFFSAASGFGTIELRERDLKVQMVEGELSIEKLVITEHTETRALDWKTVARPDAPRVKIL